MYKTPKKIIEDGQDVIAQKEKKVLHLTKLAANFLPPWFGMDF